MISQGQPELQVHFIDCGQGNMVLVVTPDGKVLLCDCRVIDENSEAILAHLESYIPLRRDPENHGQARRWIDWFVCSHRDRDHFHGLQAVNDRFPVRGIVDPGNTSGSADGAENAYYMQLRRSLRVRYGNNAVVEPRPSLTPLFSFGGVSFRCLCSGVEDARNDDGHYGNVVLQLEYGGNRILLPGDSDWRAWKEKIVPAFGNTGILKSTVVLASHHGSRSFFVDVDPFDEDEDWGGAYEDHLRLISPALTVISVGPWDACHHPNATALERYKRGTKEEQVYLTRDKGSLVGCFYRDGAWTVIPSRFLHGWKYRRFCPSGKAFRLKCKVYDGNGGFLGDIESGTRVPIGCKLEFTAVSSGGLVTDATRATYRFEVSNGGIGQHAQHDEIYPKGSKEHGPANVFLRDIAYVGTHLLRCRVRDGATGQVAQDVFVVHGVSTDSLATERMESMRQ